MYREWRCEQCGETVSKRGLESFGELRVDCPNCGNESFQVQSESPIVMVARDPSLLYRSKRSRRAIMVSLGGVLLAGGLLSLSGKPTVKETSSVAIRGTRFEPPNIEIDPGTNVTWSNRDQKPVDGGENPGAQNREPFTYHLTSASDNWDFEATLAQGESAEYTFDELGEFTLTEREIGDAENEIMTMKIGVGQSISEPVQ